MQWGVNHLGHFYLTFLLWNKVKKAEKFRVVNVSSIAHLRVLGFKGSTPPNFDNYNW